MSGGSYNYLCWAGTEELFGRTHELEQIRDRLLSLGAEDAAGATQDILCRIKEWKIQLQSAQNRMNDIWKAVEWLDSSDDSEETFKKNLEKWRNSDVYL